MASAISYHGTTKKRAEAILKSGFDFEEGSFMNRTRVPNDLGNGIYSFTDRDIKDRFARKLSMDYAKKYKCGDRSAKPACVEINSEFNTYLDMDDSENIKIFNKCRSSLMNRAEELFNKKFKDRGNSKKRANLDGIIFELGFYRGVFKDVEVLIKDTYTPVGEAKLSNFTNGTEFVIRNIKVIKELK